jgi:hypothetical protein
MLWTHREPSLITHTAWHVTHLRSVQNADLQRFAPRIASGWARETSATTSVVYYCLGSPVL